ncbi:Nn.00g041400.m01.CDS01 [Neocucurbitaria sp. VM-36]
MAAMTAVVVAAISLAILAASAHRLISLLLGSTNVTLTFSPNSLRRQEIILAMTTMIVKSMYRAIARIPALPSTKSTDQELTLRSPFRIGWEDVARYHYATRPNRKSEGPIDPSQLILFLSAMTEPAMLLLLANRNCPINPLGAVNVRNRFDLLRPDLCNLSSLKDSNRAVLFAKVHRESRPVKRGIEYDLEVIILVPNDGENGKPVSVFRQVFTMLEFKKNKGSKAVEKSAEQKITGQEQRSSGPTIQMSLSDSDPWRWAALCKDYNLIHLSGIASRLYGLPGKLAHGNHVIARALQTLLDTNKIQKLGDGPTWMEVQFKRPVRVPADLDIELSASSLTTTGIAISRTGRVSVTAEYGLL